MMYDGMMMAMNHGYGRLDITGQIDASRRCMKKG
jgi:hypothetical protein